MKWRRYFNLPWSTWLIIGVVMLIVIWPYFLAVLKAQGDYYTGINIWAGADKPVYLSQIEQARAGHLLFKNLYTVEAQDYAQLAPVWLVLGWLGKLTTLSNVAIFQLGRIFSAFIFLLVIAHFLTKLFQSLKWRNITLLIICLSSGLGIFSWQPFNEQLALLSGWFGTDLWISEGNTLLTLWHSALFILTQLAILTIFWWLADGWLKNKTRLWWAALIVLLLGVTHPYDLILVATVGVIWWLYRAITNQEDAWLSFKRSVPMAVAGFLAGSYMIWLTLSQAAFRGWAEQNVTLSPAIWNYLTGYGLLVPLAIIGSLVAWRSKEPLKRFLVFWLVVQWYLLFLPVAFQRRFSSGLHLITALVASLGLVYLWEYLLPRIKTRFIRMGSRYVIAWVLILGLTVTIGYYFYADWLVAAAHPPRIYLPAAEYQAMVWLKNNQKENQVVLSDKVTGNTLPSITGKLVFVGHGHQTNNSEEKFLYLEQVFFATNNQDQAKQDWLKKNNIAYIYFGPNERRWGSFQPETKSYLIKRFGDQAAAIYEVR